MTRTIMDKLIFCIVLGALVLGVNYIWTHIGWIWGVISIFVLMFLLVMWCYFVAPVIDNERGIHGWHGEDDDND